MVSLSKKDLEYVKSTLIRAEEMSRNVSPELFLYSDDMYIGRNDSCRVALYALDNEEYLEDLSEEQLYEIIADELDLSEYYLLNEEFNLKNKLKEIPNEKESIDSRLKEIEDEIKYIKQLVKKIRTDE